MPNKSLYTYYTTSKNLQKIAIIKAIQQDPALVRNKHQKNWILNLVTVLFVCIGIGIFAYPLVVNYVNYHQQTEVISIYDREVAKLTSRQVRSMWLEAIQYNIDLGTPALKDLIKCKTITPPLDRYEQTLDVGPDGMMAYIEVPKINLKLPLFHGTNDSVLLKGAGHIVTTQLPTTQTSVHPIITGHTGSIGHIFFDNITQLNKGDIFQLTVLNKHMSYQVDQITIIEPTDTSAIQPEFGKNWITLLTCYPYGLNNKRYLVRAKYIGDSVDPTTSPGVPICLLWVLLGMVLLIGVIVWILLSRRREFTQELNTRQLKRKLDGENKNIPQVTQLNTTLGRENIDPKLSFFRYRVILRLIKHKKYTQKQLKSQKRQLDYVIWLLLIFGLFCAWASFGLMMRTGFLPIFDLGYSWFDNHIFYFFDIITQPGK